MFKEFAKIPRLNRNCVITEKIDGTNAQICIERVEPPLTEISGYELGWIYFPVWNGIQLRMRAGSRSRWISPGDDNFGFARWVASNAVELVTLGEGQHFGEWWGSGIQRGYGLTKGEKRFSLFDVSKWNDPKRSEVGFNYLLTRDSRACPACCTVVPVLFVGQFGTENVYACLNDLMFFGGSLAAPGFDRPEGVIVYHEAARILFKATCENDGKAKGEK